MIALLVRCTPCGFNFDTTVENDAPVVQVQCPRCANWQTVLRLGAPAFHVRRTDKPADLFRGAAIAAAAATLDAQALADALIETTRIRLGNLARDSDDRAVQEKLIDAAGILGTRVGDPVVVGGELVWCRTCDRFVGLDVPDGPADDTEGPRKRWAFHRSCPHPITADGFYFLPIEALDHAYGALVDSLARASRGKGTA